jgi:hypothetical protein
MRVGPVTAASGMAACMVAWCAISVGVFTEASLAESASASTGVVLSVSPTPTSAAKPSAGTPLVTWSTGNGSPGTVTVTADGTKEAVFAYGTEGTTPAPWLAANSVYVLRLYSLAPTRRLLARIQIDHTAATSEIVGRPLTPPITPSAVDRVLQLLSFAWVALAALLVSMYVIEARRGR